VVVDDGDTGLWHPLDAYIDLTATRPNLPVGGYPDGQPLHDGGRLAWGGLLAVADGVATRLGWHLALLGRGRRDPERYRICVLDRRGTTTRPTRWIDTWDDWARRRPPMAMSRP